MFSFANMEERLMFFWFSPLFQRGRNWNTFTHDTVAQMFLPKLWFFLLSWNKVKRNVYPGLTSRLWQRTRAHPHSILHQSSPVGCLSKTQAFGERCWHRMRCAILCKRDSFLSPYLPQTASWALPEGGGWAERKGCWDKAVALLDSSGTALPSHSFRMRVFPKKSWFFL